MEPGFQQIQQSIEQNNKHNNASNHIVQESDETNNINKVNNRPKLKPIRRLKESGLNNNSERKLIAQSKNILKQKISKHHGRIFIGIKRKREEVEDPLHEVTLKYNKDGKITYKRVVTESDKMQDDFCAMTLNSTSQKEDAPTPKSIETPDKNTSDHKVYLIKDAENKETSTLPSSEGTPTAVSEDKREENKTENENNEESGLEGTVKALTEFYGTIQKDQICREIRIKRVSRPGLNIHTDIATITGRAKDYQEQLVQDRKNIREKRFMQHRNLPNIEFDEEKNENVSNGRGKFKPSLTKAIEIDLDPSRRKREEEKASPTSCYRKHNVEPIVISKETFEVQANSDDEYDYYEILDANPAHQTCDYNNNHFQDNAHSEDYDSEDSNRPDQDDYEYGGDDDEDEDDFTYVNNPNSNTLHACMGQYSDEDDVNYRYPKGNFGSDISDEDSQSSDDDYMKQYVCSDDEEAY
ncbi:unnamed protein product [Moneuplotes crassus]|uniref:Transcription factor Iwr1 domain-containing protein n=1 Tax=Euplotes crassus TaxID=5936 RepID=A0AAD1UCN0_EUPCR|nr:unnamed protein product [Moneuplotes crassus]